MTQLTPTDTLITAQRGKLNQFMRDSEATIAQMNENLTTSVARNLDSILQKQLGAFGKSLENIVAQLVQDAMSNAVKSVSDARGGFALSSLQAGADLLRTLEKAKRNL